MYILLIPNQDLSLKITYTEYVKLTDEQKDLYRIMTHRDRLIQNEFAHILTNDYSNSPEKEL